MSQQTSNRKSWNRNPKVVYTKLGRQRPGNGKKGISRTPYGLWERGLIKIDPRQSESELLDTLIHELLHEGLEELTEEGVERVALLVSGVLWREGYRKSPPDSK